jgi:hypothetical protein
MSQPELDPAFVVTTGGIHRKVLHRIYWRGQDPLSPSVARVNRYDCDPSLPLPSQFGILYLAFDLETCWMETIVRSNMVRPAGASIGVPLAKMTDRWACEVSVSEQLRLAEFSDEPLIHLGDCASNIMGDSYDRTSRWSQLLYAHANPAVDGIHYRSRFKSEQFCIALFDRAIASRGLVVHNERSIDPASSAEAQSILRKYNVVPT